MFGFGESKSVPFKPERDIPPLDGKVILVTGGNIGLGKQSVLEFARHQPALIWLGARNLDRARATEEEIKQQVANAPPIKVLELDLASLASVEKAARRVNAESDRLDILMLNAGVMGMSPGLTGDGYEVQFGTNHVGHALLAKLLLPVLEKTAALPDADVRIVALSSGGHRHAPSEGIRFNSLKTDGASLGTTSIGAFARYGQSKLANILWARQMAALHPKFTVAAVHPGVVHTNLVAGTTAIPGVVRSLVNAVSSLLFTSVEVGVKNQLWASVAGDVKSGEYYEPVGVAGSGSANAKNGELAERLWEWTEKELDGYKA